MYGSTIGNITAIIYFVCYQFCGLLIADYLFNKEKKIIRCLIGSVIGSFLLMWLPVITSLVLDFNILSHICALFLLIIILCGIVYYKSKQNEKVSLMIFDLNVNAIINGIRNNCIFAVLFIVLVVFYYLLLDNHVLALSEFGIYTGQCTYGDMNMHLGFITSIANQGAFPPEYSIMPGNALGYPFLCDSISSSLYIFGPSLKLAYCLPMLFAFIQVLGGFYAFAGEWLKDRAKSVLSFILFFFNGGLGFLYFTTDLVGEGTHNLKELFTAFYHTPTNFVDYNVRWVNVIVDMLLPQRATLFGWSILFTVLFILWKAHFGENKNYFYVAGVLAGGMVMIHTHSFLALGIICAVWLMYYLIDLVGIKFNLSKKCVFFIRCAWVTASILFMTYLREYDLKSDVEELSDVWFRIGICGIAIFALGIISMMVVLFVKKKFAPVFKTWGAFLAVVMPLALFQLVAWTFKQATGDRFVRGQFNWANIDDSYMLFYIKNIGIILFVILIALLVSEKKMFRMAIPGIAIWFIAEFLGFQPNEYDNNKLLYVGFIFLLIPAASLLIDLCRKIKPKLIGYTTIVIVVCVCSVSAVLTMGREYVSGYNEFDSEKIASESKAKDGETVYVRGYQLYANEYRGIVDYINDSADIPADAVILTDNNHNNAVSALTGRNIVVGSGSFLYYHGFDINERTYHVRLMFEEPSNSLHLFEQYNVDYVVIGSFERGSYDVDYEWFDKYGYLLYQEDGAALLKLNY